MDGEAYLDNMRLELAKLRTLGERAIAQLTHEQLFAIPAPGSNSIALVMKHLAGNMRSRWTDFLTTDGEKRDRHRDREFEVEPSDSDSSIRIAWTGGWDCLFAALDPLGPDDVERKVSIRGEKLSVVQAINRQVAHYGFHVGQIVYAAKMLAGDAWQSLSIARGASEAFNQAPSPYIPKKDDRSIAS